MNFDTQAPTQRSPLHGGPLAPRQPVSGQRLSEQPLAVAQHSKNALGSKNARAVLMLFVIAACMFAVVVAAQGQEVPVPKYDSIPLDPALTTEKAKKAMLRSVAELASSGKVTTPARAYFAKYLQGQMTAPDANQHIGEIVSDLDLHLTRAGKSNRGGGYAKLASITFKVMGKIAVGNYSPNARIAAISLISRLNDRPYDSRTKRPPAPYSKAFPVLVKLYLNEKNVDGVRAAAIDGIHRHVNLNGSNIKGAVRARLVDEMNKLLSSEPPAGRSAKAHAYLQRYAVDMLAVLKADKDPSLGMKLISISVQEEKPDLIALHSAASAGAMSSDMAGKVTNANEVVISWTKRTADAFTKELQRFASMKKRKPATSQPRDPASFLQAKEDKTAKSGARGGGQSMEDAMRGMEGMGAEMGPMGGEDDAMAKMMQGMGGMGDGRSMMGAPKEPEYKDQPAEVIASRRQLNFVLQLVFMGATGSPTGKMPDAKGGLLIAAIEADRKPVEGFASILEEVIQAINQPALETKEAYVEEVEAQLKAIQELLPESMRKNAEGPSDESPEIQDVFDLDDPLADLDG